MKWTNSVLDVLSKHFGEEPFLFDDAVKVLRKNTGYSNVAIRQALHQLVREGCLTWPGKGIYEVHHIKPLSEGGSTLPSNIAVSIVPNVLLQAEETLKDKGIDFMITGPSVMASFHHHLARRFIHLIYVVRGAGEYAIESLKEKNLHVLLNPSRKQIEVILDAFKDEDIFVIREYTNLDGNANGRATIERAIVDTYFESTRHRIPFSESEVGRIIANAFRTEKINISRMLTLASRRGIRREMESIVKELVPSLKLRDNSLNETVKKVIAGIRS